MAAFYALNFLLEPRPVSGSDSLLPAPLLSTGHRQVSSAEVGFLAESPL